MLPAIVHISVVFSILLLNWALHTPISKTSLKREVATQVLEARGGTKVLVAKVIQRVSSRTRRSNALTTAQALRLEREYMDISVRVRALAA